MRVERSLRAVVPSLDCCNSIQTGGNVGTQTQIIPRGISIACINIEYHIDPVTSWSWRKLNEMRQVSFRREVMLALRNISCGQEGGPGGMLYCDLQCANAKNKCKNDLVRRTHLKPPHDW